MLDKSKDKLDLFPNLVTPGLGVPIALALAIFRAVPKLKRFSSISLL